MSLKTFYTAKPEVSYLLVLNSDRDGIGTWQWIINIFMYCLVVTTYLDPSSFLGYMEKVGLAPINRDVQSSVSGLFSGLHDSLWRIWLYLFLNSFLQVLQGYSFGLWTSLKCTDRFMRVLKKVHTFHIWSSLLEIHADFQCGWLNDPSFWRTLYNGNSQMDM